MQIPCYDLVNTINSCSGKNFYDHGATVKFNQISSDDAVNLTSEKHDPNAQMNHLQKEENKKTLQKAPVCCRPNTLRRSS